MSDSTNVMTVDSCLGPQSTDIATDLLRIDGKLAFIAAMGDRSREVTKRMAACWNACDGIPTDDLEQKPTKDTFLRALHAIRQRDELIEALKLCKTEPRHWMRDHGQDIATQKAISKATSAIEKATGETE